MTRMRPVKGIHRTRYKAASGAFIRYHYAWRGGPRFWSSKDGTQEGGPAYWAAYQKAVADKEPAAGKFRQVLMAFLKGREFGQLAPRTQKDYRQSIFQAGTGIDAKFGDAPIAIFQNAKIRRVAYAWRDGFASPRVADARKTHLVAIINWAVDHGFLTNNHLAGMSNLYSVDRSEIIWTQHEIDLFLNGDPDRKLAPAPQWLRRLMVSALETGLRPGDLMGLSRTHVQRTPHGRRIVIRTAKRKRMVSIPVTQTMAEVIDVTPTDRMRVLVGGDGEAFTASASLGQAVSRRRDACGIRKELRFQDTRGTAATRLFEADATLREIASHMGWSINHTAKMIETYVRMNADASDGLLIKLQAEK